MKKKLFLIITLFTLSFSSLTYSASLLDSITDKLMNSIGADKLLNKVTEMKSLIGQLENIGKELENFDIDGLAQKMMVKTFDKYKEMGCDFLPDNYQNMTWEEIRAWSEDNEERLEAWLNTLDPKEVEEANKWATENIVPMANPVMNKAKELEKPLNDLQRKLNETEPLLDNFITGYRDLYSVLQDKDKALALLEQYPEWPKMQERFKDFGKAYAEGDRLEAFKILDEITGLFSNSEAGKGWLYFLEVSEQVNTGKYLSKIIKTLVKFSGSDELDPISESQIEQFLNDYIRDFKERTGIKSKPNEEITKKIREKLEEYSNNVDSFVQLPGKLDEFSRSPMGEFIQKQLEGNGKEALEDVMSKYSGVDKTTIRETGILDKIFNNIANYFNIY